VVIAAFRIAGVELRLRLGAARLGRGLPATLSLASALDAPLAARQFRHD
jgi:hypothetical protein